MGSVSFLTPAAGLVALLGVVPLVAFLRRERRASRVRRALRVGEPRPERFTLAALVAAPLLLGLAAAQPVVDRGGSTEVRSDAEVLFVLDTSRSMAAAPERAGATRLERAQAIALRLRLALADVPAGIASLTDRTLPHLFPVADLATFRGTLERSLGIQRPPPGRSHAVRATDLSALAAVAEHEYFSKTAEKRLLIVLTDGETRPVARLDALTEAGIRSVFVHVWRADEGIYATSEREPQYRADPASGSALRAAAAAARGTVVRENELDRAIEAARAALGSGPVEPREHRDLLALMAYVTLLAFVPLALLVWRRNLSPPGRPGRAALIADAAVPNAESRAA